MTPWRNGGGFSGRGRDLIFYPRFGLLRVRVFLRRPETGERGMKRMRFMEERIVGVLRDHEAPIRGRAFRRAG